MRGLYEELGVEGISLKRLFQFKMNYGPNDNEFCELYEGMLDERTIKIDSQEVASIAYYHISHLEEFIVSDQSLFAPWFIQLIRLYTGKPADLEILWDHQQSGLATKLKTVTPKIYQQINFSVSLRIAVTERVRGYFCGSTTKIPPHLPLLTINPREPVLK